VLSAILEVKINLVITSLKLRLNIDGSWNELEQSAVRTLAVQELDIGLDRPEQCPPV